MKKYWNLLKILISALHATLKVGGTLVIKGNLGTLTREKTDALLQEYSRILLKPVNPDLHVFDPHGLKFEEGKPYVIMINHSSLYDIPLTYAALPYTIRMISKKELEKVPVMGAAMRHAEVIFIDRQNRRQAVKDLAAARKLMRSGIILWMAPEGTRSPDGKLLPFKKGGFITAITAKATIIPVGFRGANKIMPAKTFDFTPNKRIEVHIGKPIDASEYKLNKKEELIARVYADMLKLADAEPADVA